MMGDRETVESTALSGFLFMIKITFSSADCGACRHRADGVRGTRARRTHERHIALVAARQRGTTAEFAALSAVRAGVEGTISQAVRGFGLRRHGMSVTPRPTSSTSRLRQR